MIPFLNNGRLTDRERAHNIQLSGARSTIERSFALLRGKWRKLKQLPSYSLVIAVDHIMACVVVHNFILLEGKRPVCKYAENNFAYDVSLGFYFLYITVQGLAGEEDFIPNENDIDDDIDLHAVVHQARDEGAVERELIARILYPNDE